MEHTFHHLGITELVPPYSHLAALYDEIMAHVQYHQWAKYVNRLIRRHMPGAVIVSDISCGTGTLILSLAEMGYRVYGSDSSAAMIKTAEEKASHSSYPAEFSTRDMQNFHLPQPAHVILSLYDSVNYLFTREQYENMFKSVYTSLVSGGLFIFDICTDHNALKYFLDYHDSGTAGGAAFKRHSYYETDTGIQNTEFAIKYTEEDVWYIERHRQQILAPETVRSYIPTNLFRCIAVLDDMNMKKATPKSERIHFILKKRSLSA
jgi:SAM-dependent methyltransferase